MAKPARSCQNRIWPLGNHYAVNSRRDRLEQRRCSVPCQRLCGDSFVRGSIIDSPGCNCSPRSGWGWRLQQSSSWSRASLGQLEGPLGVMDDGWMPRSMAHLWGRILLPPPGHPPVPLSVLGLLSSSAWWWWAHKSLWWWFWKQSCFKTRAECCEELTASSDGLSLDSLLSLWLRWKTGAAPGVWSTRMQQNI